MKFLKEIKSYNILDEEEFNNFYMKILNMRRELSATLHMDNYNIDTIEYLIETLNTMKSIIEVKFKFEQDKPAVRTHIVNLLMNLCELKEAINNSSEGLIKKYGNMVNELLE